MNILIVDDDTAFRRLLRKTLGVGEVAEAATIEAGIAVAERHPPDVVLLDVLFGGRAKGIDAIAAFRSVAPEAEVVMMTAQYSPQDEARAIAVGAFAYVEKGDNRVIQRLVRLAGRRKRAA